MLGHTSTATHYVSEDIEFHRAQYAKGYPRYTAAMTKYSDAYKKYYDEEMKASFSNIMFLKSDRDFNEMVQQQQEFNNFAQENVTFPKFSTFSGLLQNVTYPAGGKFDVGLTIVKRDGGVIGYGMSDLSYVLKEAMEVSPPEVLLQIKNNNSITGLSYIGIGVAPLIAGLVGISEILKHFAFL